MSAWFCPDCTARLERDGQIKMSFDMRDLTQEPPAGACWGCGARRLRAVPDDTSPR